MFETWLIYNICIMRISKYKKYSLIGFLRTHFKIFKKKLNFLSMWMLYSVTLCMFQVEFKSIISQVFFIGKSNIAMWSAQI